MDVNKNNLDVAQIFQVYLTFSGDSGKTAAALTIDRDTVEALATSENWPAKVAQWDTIRQGHSVDLQVQINRAVNYVQSHRLRSILDKVIQQLAAKSPEELADLLTISTEHGSELKCRALADLVKSAEAVQLMSQRALGDTAAERPEGEKERKGSSIALQVMKAMSAAGDASLDSVAIVRKELSAGQPKPMRDS